MKKFYLLSFVLLLSLIVVTAYGCASPQPAAVQIIVNGQPLPTDAMPYYQNGRVFVQARALAETLGAIVTWDESSATVNITLPDLPIKSDRFGMQSYIANFIPTPMVRINGQLLPITPYPLLKDNRVFVPVRPLAEALGARVNWDAQTLTVKVTKTNVPINGKIYIENLVDHYALQYPASWSIDLSRSSILTILKYENEMDLEIYRENLTTATPADYIWYSAKNILDEKGGIRLIAQNKRQINGMTAYEMVWTRPKLQTYDNDLNYYKEIDLVYDDTTVFTFILKTTPEKFIKYNADLEQVFASFQISE